MKSPNTRKGPLRRVVFHGGVRCFGERIGIERDVLECGHILAVAQGAYGPRYPERRCCFKCRLRWPKETVGCSWPGKDGP